MLTNANIKVPKTVNIEYNAMCQFFETCRLVRIFSWNPLIGQNSSIHAELKKIPGQMEKFFSRIKKSEDLARNCDFKKRSQISSSPKSKQALK